ncbi:MAG TPA: hypothetical protein VFU27_05540, partial [Terriglobales bacterium]|nr:hypothetical protein [Terriglobales bacterium]
MPLSPGAGVPCICPPYPTSHFCANHAAGNCGPHFISRLTYRLALQFPFMESSLRGKTALVTGANGGLGTQ